MRLVKLITPTAKTLFVMGALVCSIFIHQKDCLAAQNISLSVALSTTELALDATAFLTITVHGAQSAEIDIPEVDNLMVLRRGQSSKMQVINGEISASITYTYVVRPLQEGEFEIPAARVRVKKKTLTTEPLALRVLPAGSGSPTNAPGKDDRNQEELAFLKVFGLREKAYTGEILPVAIKAYFRQGIRVEIQKLPTILGETFVLSPLAGDPRQTIESRDGVNYSVITWQTSISPVKEGRHEFLLNLDATLLLPQANGRSSRNRSPLFDDDFFNDDFFSGFFGGIEKKNINLRIPGQGITVLPLPETGKPNDFSGAIGDFEITAEALPTTINVGDPVNLKIAISGKGNFDRVSAPPFPAGSDWKTYSPTAHFKSDGISYAGTKIFEQAIVAKHGTIASVPAMRFSYFDPQKESYITKSTVPLPLTIHEEADQEQTTAAISQSAPPKIENIETPPLSPTLPIRLSMGKFSKEIQPVFLRNWYITVVSMCTLILAGLLSFYLRKKYLRRNSQQLEKKRVARHVSDKLNTLQQAIHEDNGKRFMNECRDIIRLQLGHAWHVEPAAITLSDLQQRLPATSPLIRLFFAAEEYTYGDAFFGKEDMKKYYSLLKNEIEETL